MSLLSLIPAFNTAKVAAYALAIAVIMGTTFTATRNHYVSQITALKAAYIQAGKDAQKEQDDKQVQENYVTKETNDELKSQLTAAQSHVDRLLNDANLAPIQVCRASLPVPAGNSGAASAGASEPQGAPVEVAITSTELNDVLNVAIDNTQALIDFGQWEQNMKELK